MLTLLQEVPILWLCRQASSSLTFKQQSVATHWTQLVPPLQGSLVRTDLWYEVALLSKLLYKSKNQHRSSKHFQYLTEVCCQYHCIPAYYLELCLTSLSHHSEHSHLLSQHAVLMRSAACQVKRCMKLLLQLQLSDLVGDLNHLRSNAGVGMPATASLVMFGRYSPPSNQGMMRMSLPC